ncbi:MAG: hypothetical protein J6A53_01275 [Clostridia bacterium]|nr:hypothetical protein [Clostridia bacterium]
MKFLVSVLFCFLMSFLCFLAIKITYWMEKVDKKTDKEQFGFETDDYKINRKVRVASIIIFFVFATVGLLVLFLK